MPTTPLTHEGERLPAWRMVLLGLTVALMPLSFNIGAYVLANKKDLYVSPLDLLAGPLLLFAVWDCFRQRRRDWAPPLPFLVWALVAAASYFWSEPRSLFGWAKNAIGTEVLIGLVAVWIFRRLAPSPDAARRGALVLGASLGVCFLYALYQYVQPTGQPLPSGETGRYFGGGVTHVRVGGWYQFRAQLAGQVAMLVPACAAFAALEKDPALRIGAGAVGAIGVCVCLSGGGVLGAAAGVLSVASALLVAGLLEDNRPLRFAGGLVAAALVAVALLVLPRLPRENPQVLWRTLTLFAQTEEVQDGFTETVWKPTARLRRYQAAANYLSSERHWLLGAGAGNYNDALNANYNADTYPKPGALTDHESAFDLETHEKNAFGQLETTAVELGALGLLALAWVFLTWLAMAWAAFLRARDPATRVMALASLGVCVGAAVFSIFGSPLARGLGGTFAFFAASAWMLLAHAGNPKEEKKADHSA